MSEVLPEFATPPMVPVVPRPVIQRRELGPIIHSWGTLILDDLRATSVDYYTESIDETAEPREVVICLYRAARDALDRVVKNHRPARNEFREFLLASEGNLAYSASPETLLTDGIRSGIFMPANAYTIAQVPIDQEISLSNLVTTLRRPDFRTVMLQAGHAPNGAWGRFSTAPVDRLRRSFADDFLFDTAELRADRYKMSERCAERLKGSLSSANARQPFGFHSSRQSGGCPVRYRGFSESTIGEYALDYLGRYDLPVPPAEGPSFIEDIMTAQADIIEEVMAVIA